jgi:hypothetical protein
MKKPSKIQYDVHHVREKYQLIHLNGVLMRILMGGGDVAS